MTADWRDAPLWKLVSYDAAAYRSWPHGRVDAVRVRHYARIGMTVSEYEQLNISRVAPDVKERLVVDANERGASVNDLLAGILAAQFKVTFAGTGRRSPGSHVMEGPINLRVPPTLKSKIDLAVPREPRGRRTIVALVDRILREHYRLDTAA